MIGSYNETLSETFSKDVRNRIDTQTLDPRVIVYKDIFPDVRIKKGDGAVTRWSLEGQHASYLSTSPTGTATGFGADYLIIDDLIKSALEANNANVLQGHWDWFTNTMLSRLEEGGKIIVIMTRWHTQDLSGRILKEYANKKIRHITQFGNFYRLASPYEKTCAIFEYVAPDRNEAVVFVLGASQQFGEGTMSFKVPGLDLETVYELTVYGGEGVPGRSISGQGAATVGVRVELFGDFDARILHFRKANQ